MASTSKKSGLEGSVAETSTWSSHAGGSVRVAWMQCSAMMVIVSTSLAEVCGNRCTDPSSLTLNEENKSESSSGMRGPAMLSLMKLRCVLRGVD
jgi:hypothetical protein